MTCPGGTFRLVRPRLWLEEESEEKQYAYETMYYVMRQLVTLLAPFTPHITEVMYDNIRLPGDPVSVHMLPWFTSDPGLIDSGIESGMSIVQSFDEAQANARQSGKRSSAGRCLNVLSPLPHLIPGLQ